MHWMPNRPMNILNFGRLDDGQLQGPPERHIFATASHNAGGAFVLTIWLTVIFVMSSIALDAMDGT